MEMSKEEQVTYSDKGGTDATCQICSLLREENTESRARSRHDARTVVR
jgi:hypothetical protein